MDAKNELEAVIAEIYKQFEDKEVDVDEVMELLGNYKPCRQEWLKFAKFDRHKYTRNLIDTGNGKFNLMLLCWGPSLASSIHDHTDAHCFMKILDGNLQEKRYTWPKVEGEELIETGTTKLNTNDVCYINDSMGLHRVENADNTEGAVSLHLYCPPFDHCQAFDERTGHALKCPVTFYSKFGEKVQHIKAKKTS